MCAMELGQFLDESHGRTHRSSQTFSRNVLIVMSHGYTLPRKRPIWFSIVIDFCHSMIIYTYSKVFNVFTTSNVSKVFTTPRVHNIVTTSCLHVYQIKDSGSIDSQKGPHRFAIDNKTCYDWEIRRRSINQRKCQSRVG